MKIVFYNHYHNGDIFASKAYVEDIIKEFPGYEFYYQHFNSSKLLRDVNIEFRSLEVPLGPVTDRTPFLVDKDTIFINTWIANYLELGNGINWITYQKMFRKIYSFIEDETDKKIEVGPAEYYIPEIKYEYFDIPDINIPKDSILISNGPTMSGQSALDSMDSVVNAVLENTDSTVILTHFSNIRNDKIVYTNNLINTSGGDLNEISWVASNCKYIIGRNSGPFCFTHTKKILNDPEKTLISIGNNKNDSFPFGMKLKSNYNFIDDARESVNDKLLEIINQ
jgi:hypothetical protein